MICCSRLTSVTSDFGSGCSMSIRKSRCFDSAKWRKLRSIERCRSSMRDLADVDRDRARLDLRQVEDVVDQHQQVVARRVDRLRELDLLAASGCRRGFLHSWSERISRLLSGVRSSCDMLARNSDLYFDVSASCSAFSSSAWRACSTSWFLRSTSWFWCASRRAFSCSSSLVCCSSCWRLCSSSASDCDCVSRSSVRDVGLDRVDDDADRLGQLVEERLVRPG